MRHQAFLQLELNAGISDTYGLASLDEMDFLYDERDAHLAAIREEQALREGDAVFELDFN